MALFKYNEQKLAFEKTNKLLKYRAIVGILVLLFSGALMSAVKFKTEVAEKESIIKEKEQRIKEIKVPLREDSYVEDLYNNIGFTLTKKQHERFSKLSLKYRSEIEKAKVPATLVWYIAYKESRFDNEAMNKVSSSKGLFQFLDGTWNACCKMVGENNKGRFDEDKQVRIMLVYLNYLYNKHGDWKASVSEYHGGEYLYPINFLFK